MDKYEYRVRADEIKELIAQGEFVQAAQIADTIDWRRVKSVMMLCTVSDLYKINRRYEEARDMLLLAYEQRPGGRTIVYSLCELSIKMEDVVQAVEYYKEFVQIAPKDSGRYILQYKLYEAQDVSLEERIEVLEELKKRDYREKWAYELAYLYHRVGLATKCVEECDELILWFGEGRYVVKAMELKMLHQPLTEEQQYKYDHRFDEQVQEVPAPEEAEQAPENEALVEEAYGAETYGAEAYPEEPVYENGAEQGEVLTEDVALQEGYEAVTSENEESVPEEAAEDDIQSARTRVMDLAAIQKALNETDSLGDTKVFPGLHMDENGNWVEGAKEPEEMDIQVKTLDMGQYNTINLQEELAAGLKELLESEDKEANKVAVDFLRDSSWDIDPNNELKDSLLQTKEVFPMQPQEGLDDGLIDENYDQYEETYTNLADAMIPAEGVEDQEGAYTFDGGEVPAPEPLVNVELPHEMAKVLSQESDGQIRLVVPEHEQVESQITGQLSIEDILSEWERLKRENEEKRKEEVRQHVMEQTGSMFTEFEASMRDGLLERLENGETTLEEALAAEQAAQAALSDQTFEEEITDALAQSKEDTLDEFEELEEVAEDTAKTLEEAGEATEEVAEEAVEEVAEAVKEAEDDTVEELEEIIEQTAEEAAEEATEVTEEVAEEAAEATEETVAATEKVAEKATEAIEEVAEEAAEATEEVAEEAAEATEKVAEEADEVTEEVTAEATEATEEVAEEAAEVTEEAAEATEEVAEEAAEATEEVAEEEKVAPIEFEEPIELEEEASENAEAENAEGESAEAAEEISEEKDSEEAESEEDSEVATEDTEGNESEDSEVAEDNKENDSEDEGSEEDQKATDENGLRALTSDEIELYAPYIQKRSAKEQLIHSIDNISLAACTGNMIVTGTGGVDTIGLVKSVIKEIQMNDTNFSGKVAKIAGGTLNKKEVSNIINPLKNGALIIEEAGNMNDETIESLHKCLSNEMFGIEVFLIDGAKIINKMLTRFAWMKEFFNARVDIEAMSNDSLVAFAKHYAKELEYSIDDLGILALHTRIDELQTSDHAVTTMEVKEMVDEAIHHVNRKTIGHFMDILLAKRYDEEDMVILTEKDFM